MDQRDHATRSVGSGGNADTGEPDPWMKFRTAEGRMDAGSPGKMSGTQYSMMKGGVEGREWVVGGFPVWSRKDFHRGLDPR